MVSAYSPVQKGRNENGEKYYTIRGVARGGTRAARAPQNLADQLTLFKPGGADYAPHTIATPHSEFYLHLWYIIRNVYFCSWAEIQNYSGALTNFCFLF